MDQGNGSTEIFSVVMEKIDDDGPVRAFEALSVIPQPLPASSQTAPESSEAPQELSSEVVIPSQGSRRSRRQSTWKYCVPHIDPSLSPEHVETAKTLLSSVDLRGIKPRYGQLRQIETAVARLVKAGHDHEQLGRYLRIKAREARTVIYFLGGCDPARVADDLDLIAPPRAAAATPSMAPDVPAQEKDLAAELGTEKAEEPAAPAPAPETLSADQIDFFKEALLRAHRNGTMSSPSATSARRLLAKAGINPEVLLELKEAEEGHTIH
jgi:hypothetical protein